MLEWLDRYMAKFAQTDHIRREEHARRQEEASPAHEEAVALLEAFPYSGPGRARVIAAALSAITQETLLDAAYARRLLRAMVEGFSQADADVQTTLAPAQVALNLLPTLRAAATAGGSVGAPFALIEGTLAMRTGQFDVAIKRLGDANRELRASLVEDWSELLPSSLDGDMLPAAVELAADTLSQLENPDLCFWTRVLLTVPGDQLGVPHPDELLLAAGELALNLHRTAGLVNKPEPDERRQLLAHQLAKELGEVGVSVVAGADDARGLHDAAAESAADGFGALCFRARGGVRGVRAHRTVQPSVPSRKSRFRPARLRHAWRLM